MKKRLLLFLLWGLSWTVAKAQLPPGSVAPDFTVTDINGQTHNLYSLLNQGKTVYLDFFATWCGPCWNYHNGHALRTIWEQYGPDGTDEAFVIAIEGDPATNVPCIYGPAGCNNTTQGDWTLDTPYPIADDAGVRGMYSVAYYPTIYMVCPGDKKVYETGQLNATGLWNRRSQYCALNASVSLASVENVRCFNSSTGKITVTPGGAIGPYTYTWSTGATTTTPVLNNVPAGTYAVTVTPAQGTTATLTDIVVEGPSGPITAALVESLAPGCNNVPGYMTIEAAGGWTGDYNYVWNNGQNGPEVLNIMAGTYTVTITDDGGCTKTQAFTLAAAPPLVVNIAPPASITCAQPTIQINASASSSGDNITYNWFASNGGVIVSGANTLTPVVSAAGTYTLQISNAQTTCNVFGNTSVTTNIVPPTANAGSSATLNCNQPTATLQGSGSTGANFAYAWTGGNVVSGGNTLTPVVGAAGTYTLQVTNTSNGCTATSTTTVTGNNSALAATAAGGALTCATTSVTLNAGGAIGTATYTWSGPNNYTSTAQNPTVNATGTYTVLVTDQTGCSGTATATVSANTATPGATATGGTITCVTNSIALQGSSAAPNATYAWSGPNNYAATGATPNVTVAGDYQLVVVDPANGCTSTAVATVTANTTAPTAAIAVPPSLNCNNVQVQLNATASSQGANFTYNWTTANGLIVSGASTPTPTITEPGIYILSVTNTVNGCTNSAQTAVFENAPVTSSASVSAVTCNGANNGSATVNATGGTGNFTYAWSNGAATATANSLAAGTYAVVVTDTEGCSSTASVEVTQPAVLAANATATAQSANGVNDGTATAAPTGGTSGYTYLWNNGETTAAITGLTPGTYTVVVTDANNCAVSQVVTVNAFNCALAATISAQNLLCANSTSGSASVNLLGAVEPVTYTWSNGGNTATITGLTAGTYTVAVMDGNNCPAELSVAVTAPPSLQANVTTTNETASGANNGSATAAPVGGTSPYTYLWSNNETTATINNLAPGIYVVVVTDANNCTASRSVTVASFDCALAAEYVVSQVACFGQATGSISVGITGGAAPFNYVWSNGANTATVTGLAAGSYTVQITDGNGCEVTNALSVSQPTAINLNMTGVTNTVCPEDETGAIEVTINGGTTGYTYLWSNGATSQDLELVAAGAYTLVATDANGCTAAVSATITSNDNVAPTVAADNSTLALDASGNLTVTADMLNAVAADNCSSVTLSVPAVSYTCSDLGTHQIVLTATDQAGNTATVEVTVEVVDNTAPVVVCPANIIRCATDPQVNYDAPTASDNCLQGGSWNLLAGLPTGSIFPAGATTVQTYSYTDASGNMGTCSFDVTVHPAVTASGTVTNATNNEANGAITLDVTGGVAPYSFLWSNGATTQNLTNLMAGVYTVQVLDGNGCKVNDGSPLSFSVENVVNTTEPEWANGMTIMPNPTTGLAKLVFKQLPSQSVQLHLFDASGRLVSQRILDGVQQAELDLSNMPQGLYLLRISSGNAVSARRISVQR